MVKKYKARAYEHQRRVHRAVEYFKARYTKSWKFHYNSTPDKKTWIQVLDLITKLMLTKVRVLTMEFEPFSDLHKEIILLLLSSIKDYESSTNRDLANKQLGHALADVVQQAFQRITAYGDPLLEFIRSLDAYLMEWISKCMKIVPYRMQAIKQMHKFANQPRHHMIRDLLIEKLEVVFSEYFVRI